MFLNSTCSVGALLACQATVILSLTAYSVQGLYKEGEISLREYLEDCAASGINPYAEQEKIKTFTLRYPESLGERLSQAAAQNETSLNAFIIETLNERLKRR